MRLVLFRFGDQKSKGGVGADDSSAESHIPNEAVDVHGHPREVVDRLPQRTDKFARLFVMKRNWLMVWLWIHCCWTCLVRQPRVRHEHNCRTEHVQQHAEE